MKDSLQFFVRPLFPSFLSKPILSSFRCNDNGNNSVNLMKNKVLFSRRALMYPLVFLFMAISSHYAIAQDADNDGVLDSADLDDDNDGILDTDEGCTGFVFPEDFFVPLYHANIINSDNGQIFLTGQDADPNGTSNITAFTELTSPTWNFTGATVKLVGADGSDP